MRSADSNNSLISRLKKILIKQRLVLFTAGLFVTGAAVLIAGVILSLLASVVILPVWLKISLLSASALAGGYLFFKYAVSSLFSENTDQVAIRLENKHPELKGRLIAAVQFLRMKTDPGYSRDLIELTEQQALSMVAKVNFNEAISFYSVLRGAKAFAVAGVVALLLVTIFPGLFTYSYEVYSNPTTEIAPPLGYRLSGIPGSIEWVKYRDIEIGATLIGSDFPEDATIFHRLVGGSWQQTIVPLKNAIRHAIDRGDSLDCTLTLRQINKSFDYYVKAGRRQTEVFQVDVVDRPRVTGIRLSAFYPKYTGLPPTVVDENDGSISAVIGTRISLQIMANLPVQSGELIFSDSSRTPINFDNTGGDVSLLMDSSRSYHVRLVDRLGEENPDPIEYYLTAIPDEYPVIEVLSPGFDINLSDNMLLPLKVRIFDDYGFSSLVLKYTTVRSGKQSDETVAVLHYSDRIKTEGDVEFNWDIERMRLNPGDYVVYHLEIADNDQISGPKVTASRQYIARLPSLDEMIAEAAGESNKRVDRTEELLKMGKEVMERMKSAARKIESQNQQVRKADWQQQKELESILDKNSQMMQQIEKAAQQMDKSLQKMQQNAQMSREVMEKLAQIQKLYEEVATPEMKEAQRKLMEAMKNMDRKQLQKAMDDFKLTQQELLERLERTLALLKKMQVEQKMQAMMRKVEQLAKKQEKMNQKTSNSAEEQLSPLSKEEDAVKSDFDDLKKDVAELEELMKAAEMDQAEEPQKFAEAVKKSDAGENMQSMSKSLSQEQKQEASDQGKEAYSKLMEMLDQMQQQMMAMQGADSEAIERAMRQSMQDTNYLSQNQEELLLKAAALHAQTDLSLEMATRQQELQASCNGLKKRFSELGKESPFIAAELGRLIDQATKSMDMATESFDIRQTGKAKQAQQDAMVQLNKASIRLMESLEQQKQCDKGGNCSKSMSKLQSLCNKQNKLNQQTKGQCNKPGSGNPKEGENGRAQMQRLAGEQGAIRKSMEQLSAEFGNSRQILGRLDDIADEMRAVEEDLADGEAGPDVVERQLKIFSRMLEASRSLQRRDYTEQRKANVGDSRLIYLPDELSSEFLNDRTNFEDRLRKFLSDDYPPQYEAQVRAYFRALMNVRPGTPESAPASIQPSDGQ